MSINEQRYNRPAVICRRRFLKQSALAAGAMLVPGVAAGGIYAPNRAPRGLTLFNLHTDEYLKVVYWENGGYVGGALDEINHILRDFRVNEVKPIAPPLLDLLYSLQRRLYTDAPFHVISGYRSPRTNAMLAAHSEGVATHSLHIEGKAIDIRVPGRSLRTVQAAALSLRGGGVGYYPRSDFVHVDIGRVRWW